MLYCCVYCYQFFQHEKYRRLVFLEDKNVGFGVDHDVIHFGNWKDDVRQIKLRVTDGPLKMYKMIIHFDNGSIQNVELRNRFAQGSESRVIDMDGGLRHLTKIEILVRNKRFYQGKVSDSRLGEKLIFSPIIPLDL
ncbi:MAG: hypothetical protein IPJ29_00020 [Chitinophagaceae bacterium]|nr:hypothetical protein [Chitinophagaceae bacterium]